MSDLVAKAARLIAEPARAAMLVSLMDGRALPAGELAQVAHISPQTASEHLAKLAEANFVFVRKQGRHRYYELANEEIAYAVESLLVLSGKPRSHGGRNVPAFGSLEYARTCYGHLAGWIAVAITDALLKKGYLVPAEGRELAVTNLGKSWFAQHGIACLSPSHAGEGNIAHECLDWTERRPHIAGPLGVAMYRRMVELAWIAPTRKSRAVRITLKGREALLKQLNIVAG